MTLPPHIPPLCTIYQAINLLNLLNLHELYEKCTEIKHILT